MIPEHQRLLKEIINRVIFHGTEYYPGYKSEFIATFTRDEYRALQEIQKELEHN